MTDSKKLANRYWGLLAPPSAKDEFFNAFTAPAPSGAGTVATIRMYGPIDSWGGRYGISTSDVGEVLDTLPDEVTQIILRINSPGGEVFEGLSILNMFRAHKARVTAVVDGIAASAASFLAAGCDETVMSPGTTLMIHSPLVFSYGNAADLRKSAEVLDSIESSLIEIYTAKAGKKDWAALLAEETWLNAEETVKLGLADRVAVIPDAGETEMVGTSDDDPDEGDYFDIAARARDARAHDRAVARSQELPSSSEPGDPNRKENAVAYSDLTAGLRERLGVTDATADDETLLAALDEALEEQADTTPAPAAAALPAGFTAIDESVLAELQANARAGADARAEQESARRDGIVATALREGRIASASKDAIRAQLDKDEEGTSSFLATLPKNSTVPVAEVGHSDTLTSSDDALYNAAFGSTTKEA